VVETETIGTIVITMNMIIDPLIDHALEKNPIMTGSQLSIQKQPAKQRLWQ